jgi:phosphohistidine swiveling domain-containing protein
LSASQNRVEVTAGQIAWTRDLARDLFPAAVTPFHWTLLRRPAQEAMRRTWADLGVVLPAADFWHRAAPDGYVYLNADLVAQASRAVHGAAWLSGPPPPERGGLFGRWQTQGTIKRVQAQVDAVAQEADGLNQRLAEWFAFVQRLRWTQADLLQVMEELEPRAESILQAYFALRAGLSAVQAEVAARLTEWLPNCSPQTILHLYAGLDGLPSVEAAYALAALRDASNQHVAVQDFLTRDGHRGLDEMRPDARRWREHADVALQLAALPPMHDVEAARAARRAAEEWVLSRLDSNRRRQFEPLLARARRLCCAVDVAWDGLARVMAAAQLWLRAVAVEAVCAGLIADPAEVHFLELEELKQVATGEWHRGRSERVREEVVQRRRRRAGGDLAACMDEPARSPVAASPGAASGPAFRLEPLTDLAFLSGAVVLTRVAAPGDAPYWLSAAAVVDAAGDLWTPGMIVARAMAVPAVTGMAEPIAQAAQRQIISVDGSAGRVSIEAPIPPLA